MPLVSGLVLEKSSAVGNSSKVMVFHVKWLDSVSVEEVFLTAINRINRNGLPEETGPSASSRGDRYASWRDVRGRCRAPTSLSGTSVIISKITLVFTFHFLNVF